MDSVIGTNIHTLRKIKGMTQAELAAAVGVSTPAVSKWERNISLPDITLLAPLARCLGVSADELLSFTAELSDEEIERIYGRCNAAFSSSFEDGMACCENYLHQYPGDPKLSFVLAGAMQKYLFMITDEKEAESILPLITQLYETSAASGGEYGEAANGILISLYTMSSQLEKAEKLARELPEGMFRRNKSLTPILYQKGETEEAQKLDQQGLYYALHDTLVFLTSLASLARKEQRVADAIAIYETLLEMTRAFGLETLSWQIIALEGLAEIYAVTGEEEKALDYLERFAEKFPVDTHWDLSNNILFDKLHFNGDEQIPDALRKSWREQLHEIESFEPMRKHPRFQAVLQCLDS